MDNILYFYENFINSKTVIDYYKKNNIVLSNDQLLWMIQHSISPIKKKKEGLEELYKNSLNQEVSSQIIIILSNILSDERYISNCSKKCKVIVKGKNKNCFLSYLANFGSLQSALEYTKSINNFDTFVLKFYSEKDNEITAMVIIHNSEIYDISTICQKISMNNPIENNYYYFPHPFKVGDKVNMIEYPQLRVMPDTKCFISSIDDIPFLPKDDSDVGLEITCTDLISGESYILDRPVSPFLIEYSDK